MNKNPSNRHSLPKLVISKVDDSKILEFKVKYEKLARLDKFDVQMSYDNSDIIFDDVLINGKDKPKVSEDKKEITFEVEGKSYTISGKKVGGKLRKNGKISQAKVMLTIRDNIRKNEDDTHRQKSTERELLKSENIKIFKYILKREPTNSQEIYLVKRFLAYRSDLLLFYGFVNNFFHPTGDYKEFWKLDFDNKHIKYFKYTINDSVKNKGGFLEQYVKDEETIRKDLEKCKKIFAKLRHSLMHYNFDFFNKLFNGESVGLDFDIEFLNKTIEHIDKLKIDTHKDYIESKEIELFKEKIKFGKLYKIYAYMAINRVAFNKFINDMIIKDGVENSELKEVFKSKGKDYYIDIHQNKEYKKLYNEHKKLVSKLSATSNGKEIADINNKIFELKDKMDKITKANSTNRLECKLRLAFGFIYGYYNNYDEFKKIFDTDIKANSFDSLTNSDYKRYFESTFDKEIEDEKIADIEKHIDSLSLKNVIGDSELLKLILLIFIFLPKEIKGEFLGFVKKYYHDTKHIFEDTKDTKDKDSLGIGLRLKILDKNIRVLSVLKHSLSQNAKYNKKAKEYYEEGNANKKFYKKLGISHNIEEFDKSIYLPLFRYYSALYKLINDFEMYALSTHIQDGEFLDEQTQKRKFKNRGHYNFRKLLNETFGNENSAKSLIDTRNEISHLNIEALFDCPLNKKKNYKRGNRTINVEELQKARENIVNYIKSKDTIKVLGYDAVNDFTMKVVHLQTKLNVYADKTNTIKKLICEAKSANDYYNIYKVKAIEAINNHLLEIIGKTDDEIKIKEDIARGNKVKSDKITKP